MDDFQRLEDEFADELKWTKTRDIAFEDLLVKSRMNTGTVNLRVAPPQIQRLKKLYFDAGVRDQNERGKQ